MPVYTEKVKDKITGKMIDKIVDGKKQYYIRTYVEDQFGNSKQITRHNKKWLGIDGKKEASREESRLQNSTYNDYSKMTLYEAKPITLKELEDKYLEFKSVHVDKDTLKTIKNKLSHFCEKDKTGQVKTYPNDLINLDKRIWKDRYKKWQIQMRNKKYKKGNQLITQNEIQNNIKCSSYSIKNLNTIHSEILRMLDFGIEEGYLSYNFAKQSGKFGSAKEIKLSNGQPKHEIITYDEFKMLLKACEDDFKYKTLFNLWFKRGLRPGEIRALKVNDFDYNKHEIMINHTMSKANELKDPKTASSKDIIDLDDELNNQIHLLIENLKKKQGFNEEWYIFNGATPISSNAMEKRKNTYFKKAGINKHITLHEFRHSCASWLISIGIPFTVVSKILRHKDVSVTLKTYTHLTNNEYDNWMNKINKIA